MRILILSDIHSNLTALNTVLDSTSHFDAVWCLGDLVGYGPDANECIQRVRQLPNLVCVRGNHDAALLGDVDQQVFNHDASLAITWTRHIIDSASRDFLASLPEKLEVPEATLVHGSPINPVWDYLMDYPTALQCFPHFQTRLCLVGHTHVPAIWAEDAKKYNPVPDYLRIPIRGRAILNPGSVGQPRDHDRRAAFAVWDSEASTWELRRVEYDIRSVQERIKKAGLPWRHAMRLMEGW